MSTDDERDAQIAALTQAQADLAAQIDERDDQIAALVQAQDALAGQLNQLRELHRAQVEQLQGMARSTPPVGSILLWTSKLVPSGYLPCDGSVKSPADLPELFAVIGNSYGGDGVVTFKLPDFRGVFIRGIDDMGTERGPARRDLVRQLGQLQDEELKTHRHGHSFSITNHIDSLSTSDSGVHRHSFTVFGIQAADFQNDSPKVVAIGGRNDIQSKF